MFVFSYIQGGLFGALFSLCLGVAFGSVFVVFLLGFPGGAVLGVGVGGGGLEAPSAPLWHPLGSFWVLCQGSRRRKECLAHASPTI